MLFPVLVLCVTLTTALKMKSFAKYRSSNQVRSIDMHSLKYEYSGVFTEINTKPSFQTNVLKGKRFMQIEESDEIKLTYDKVHIFGGVGMDKGKTDNKELKFLFGGKGKSKLFISFLII